MRAEKSAVPWGSYTLALLATLIWGLSFVAIRVALEGFGPFEIVWLRNALAAALLLGLLQLRGDGLWPRREDRGRCLVLGAILGLHLLGQTAAMQWTSATSAGLLIAFIPAVIAIGSWMFLRRGLRAVGWLGVALASCGVLVLTAPDLGQLAGAGGGDLLMLATCFSWAAFTLLSVGPIARNGALRVTAFAMLVSVPPNLLAALAFPASGAHATTRAVVALAFLGTCASALAMWAFNRAVAELGPTRSAAFQYLQPFVTLAGAWFYLGEPLTPALLAGGPIVLAGVWLIQRGQR